MYRIKRLLLYIVMILSSCTVISGIQKQDDCSFNHTTIASHFFKNETKIEYDKSGQEVGYLYYIKVPLFPYYILYDFYVTPNYRNKGFGTKILSYTCDYLKGQGASKIYIQPGPFEIDQENRTESLSSYTERLTRLVNFYRKNQFVEVSAFLQYLTYIVYKCIGIEEDASYLMVRILR